MWPISYYVSIGEAGCNSPKLSPSIETRSKASPNEKQSVLATLKRFHIEMATFSKMNDSFEHLMILLLLLLFNQLQEHCRQLELISN